ncbi:hypothetical protein ACTG9Q_09890 [Actinokineospora sp. 24-640]
MLVLIALAAALVLLLDRNHRAGQRLAGTTDVIDRDWARISADLAAVDPIPRHREVSARTAATVRLATGPR